jgi:LPXTG-motif cell wall-anchored protein
MGALKITAIVLIAAGIAGLVHGGYTYTTQTHEARLGPIELSVNEDRTANIPVWAGVGAIVLGGGLVLVGRRKS